MKSLCPSIFGNELVKTGQLLSLFGGTDYRQKGRNQDFVDLIGKDEKGGVNADDEMEDEKSMPPIRPDIHMLMVGEPGLGKS